MRLFVTAFETRSRVATTTVCSPAASISGEALQCWQQEQQHHTFIPPDKTWSTPPRALHRARVLQIPRDGGKKLLFPNVSIRLRMLRRVIPVKFADEVTARGLSPLIRLLLPRAVPVPPKFGPPHPLLNHLSSSSLPELNPWFTIRSVQTTGDSVRRCILRSTSPSPHLHPILRPSAKPPPTITRHHPSLHWTPFSRSQSQQNSILPQRLPEEGVRHGPPGV